MSRHAQGTFYSAKKHSLTVMNIFTPIIKQQSSVKKKIFFGQHVQKGVAEHAAWHLFQDLLDDVLHILVYDGVIESGSYLFID